MCQNKKKGWCYYMAEGAREDYLLIKIIESGKFFNVDHFINQCSVSHDQSIRWLTEHENVAITSNDIGGSGGIDFIVTLHILQHWWQRNFATLHKLQHCIYFTIDDSATLQHCINCNIA